MISLGDRQQFWDEESATARFSHPVNQQWIREVAQTDSRILDYGCGYGRTISSLLEMGFRNVTGMDLSLGMLDRARAAHPDVHLVFSDEIPTPFADNSFDVVLLLAVLTTVPEDESQRTMIHDVRRLLRPGGHLYVSDLPLQTDERRVARYQTARPEGLPYGTFQIDEGRAVMRHHTEEWFSDLFSAFHVVRRDVVSVATMRGQTADAVQFLLQKPAA